MTLAILILEDEPEVRDALRRDLESFSEHVLIEMADTVDDAWAAVEDIADGADRLALILADHRLPGKTGVDFLVETMDDPRTATAFRILVTGQADQADTIRAINEANLDHYIAKPWDRDELVAVVRQALTEFVLQEGIDPLPYMPVLDQVAVMESLRRGN